MNLLTKGIKSLVICTFSVALAQAAFAQNTDSTTIHAIDTLNFENISNESLNSPAPAPAPSTSQPAGTTVSPSEGTENVPAEAGTSPVIDTTTTPAATTPAVINPTDSMPAPVSTASPVDTTTGTGSPAMSSSGASSEETPATRARQKTFTGLNKFRRFSVGANVGIATLATPGINDYYNNQSAVGYGLTLNYHLGRVLTLQGEFHMHGDLSGDSLRMEGIGPSNFTYKNQSAMDYSINAVFNLGNISFISKKNNIGIFASIGAGLASYTSEIAIEQSPIFRRSSESAIIFPLGVGVKYRITNEITAVAGYSLRFMDTDGYDKAYTNDNTDKYSYAHVGFTYMLGKKSKPSIEWSNPVASMFEDLAGGAQNAQLRKKVVSLQEQIDSLEARMNTRIDSLRADADGDGIPDFTDKESDTPKGAMVDATGKSLDSDGDGIIDFYDRCPFEKGTVAFNGCKKMPMKMTRKEETTVKNVENKVLFVKNSNKLNDDSKRALDNLVDIMNKNKGYKLLISGYTDSDGDKALNERLSQQRANAVKNYLVEQGIAENRLKAQGLGEKVYLDNNITSAGKQQNRAVTLEFVVF